MAHGTAISALAALCACAASGYAALPRPVWRDPDQSGKRAFVTRLDDGSRLRVVVVAADVVRVRRTAGEVWTESGMNRYGIVRRLEWDGAGLEIGDGRASTEALEVSAGKDGEVRVRSRVSGADLSVKTSLTPDGGAVRFPLAPGERVFGLGDVHRGNIQRRPGRYEIFVKNVNSYIPVPMAMTSGGWGVFMNTTWKNWFDVGKADADAMNCGIPVGDLDFYVFVGSGYRELLDAYTRLTGRPQLLPSFAFGFAYVCNQYVNEFELVNEATWFEKLGLPIDIIGLEPGWMETFYDHSTKKRWDPKRFGSFPFWCPVGKHIFPSALERMGINLSLWMCCDYDLFRYEEQCAAGEAKRRGESFAVNPETGDTWVDPRIEKESVAAGGKVARPTSVYEWDKYLDMNAIDKKYLEEARYPEGALPWFRHLEKFCDQGARCWKLDGNLQVCQIDEHPGRVYVNGMSVEEAHNLYPVVYDKQMAQGYEQYTGRRAMVYSAGGYAGVQAYVATWAGDTGGGEKTLVSTLNLGLTGHPNQSCDMTLASKTRMHYGFLAPWSQANDWDSFHRPWTEGEEAERSFRHYAALRYSLFPYIYAAAAEASRTGWPIARALALEFPGETRYDDCFTTYLLGPDLLVSAFGEFTDVPPGTWYDWRTGRRVEGPCRERIDLSGVWGGGLLAREGAIVPRLEGRRHLPRGWYESVVFDVWPKASGESSRVWYEDDGDSLGYRDGEFSETRVSCSREGGEIVFRIAPRRGSFKGMPRSHYVKLRFRLDARPDVDCGEYDWYAKMFSVDLGDVDADTGAEFRLKAPKAVPAFADGRFKGVDLGDIFLKDSPGPVRAFDREGREIRVAATEPSYARLMEMKDEAGRRRGSSAMRVTLTPRSVRPEIAPLLKLVDAVVLKGGSEPDAARRAAALAELRRLAPDIPVHLAQEGP
ncbi:MAG: glycoside hydrolase family 31 protein [Kiritimatiellae bacterium]|nr:glycoside hydrolase family 31 protein [Kiritimatiellia bacterium]